MRGYIREDIEGVIKRCFTIRQLCEALIDMGYKYDGSGKHAKLRLPGAQRFIHTDSLGPGYTENELCQRVAYRIPSVRDWEVISKRIVSKSVSGCDRCGS